MSQNVYHFNPETGRTGKCSATVKGCLFAVNGEIPEHYNTAEEAQTAYEQQMSSHTLSNSLSKTEQDKFGNLSDEEKQSMKAIFLQAKNTFKDLAASFEDDEEGLSEEVRIQNEKEGTELDNLIAENRSYYTLDEIKYSDYLHNEYDEKESLITNYDQLKDDYDVLYSADYMNLRDREILDTRLDNIEQLLIDADESNEDDLNFYSKEEINGFLTEANLVLQQKFSLDRQELMSLDKENSEIEKDRTIEMAEKQSLINENLNKIMELEDENAEVKRIYKISDSLRRDGFDREKDLNSYLKEYVKRLKS